MLPISGQLPSPKSGWVFQMSIPPNRVDVITDIDGVLFDKAWSGREMIEIEGIRIPILEKSLLLVDMQALDRPKDQLDVF